MPPQTPPPQTLQGTLERITFQNPENGFLVGRFLCEKDPHPVTVRGTLTQVHEGERLKLVGNWEEHPRYGQQFLVESYEALQPNTLEGMERYLASTLNGVGETLAKRIVKTFGARTFEILDRQPELLLEVPRFTRKALGQVQAAWQEHRAARDALVFLHSLGVSPGLADRVFKAYGLATVEAVKANPYRLALEVQGVGFRTADALGGKLGVAKDAPERMDAGLLHVLDEMGGEGHTGYPQALLLQRGAQMLEVGQDLVELALQRLLSDGLLRRLTLQGGSGSDEPARPEEALVFRPRLFRAEEQLVAHLQRIQAGQPLTRFKGVGPVLAGLEQRLGLTLAPEQRSAIQSALENKLLIITGGPGTGKTTIVRFILGLVEGVTAQVDLAAPTGKAAKRLTETTGKPAVTIHRLLEAGQRGFGRNAQHPLETELLIVDEVSMIDTLLMEALLAALPTHARLVLVGDVDQLPSVGPGRVLADLIQSQALPVARLEHIFRQSERSMITANAHAIRRGVMPDLGRPEAEDLVDFYFVAESDPARIVDKVLGLVAERIPERFGFNPREEIQVMTPMHRGLTGSLNLNQALQARLNPQGQPVPGGDPPFRVGDRVIQNRNDYEREVFNGDVGTVVAYHGERQVVDIQFDERIVPFERKHLDTISLAYAITVHKAQGSEYPAVVLPLHMQHAILLQRNLLYTALTRGRRLAVIVGMERAVRLAVGNARPLIRHTGLVARLTGKVAPAAPPLSPPPAVGQPGRPAPTP